MYGEKHKIQGIDYPYSPEYIFPGTEGSLTPDSVMNTGGSVIISPIGKVLAGPNYNGEGLISADLGMHATVFIKQGSLYTLYLMFAKAM